jgi:hypothetical protein
MSLRERWRWVYFLPTVHLLVSSTRLLLARIPSLNFMAFAWMFVMLVDLPISLVSYFLGWKHPGVALVWVIVVGTLWWYLLSKIVEVLFRLVAGRDGSPSVYTSGRLGTGSRVASWKWPAAKRL